MELYWHTPLALNVAAGTHLVPGWAASSASAAVQSWHRPRQAAARRVQSGRPAYELAGPRLGSRPLVRNQPGRRPGWPEPRNASRCGPQTSPADTTVASLSSYSLYTDLQKRRGRCEAGYSS